MSVVFVGLGSNIDAEKNTRLALQLLATEAQIVRLSTFYWSKPVGGRGGPRFLNGAAMVETEKQPLDFKRRLRSIEAVLGRQRTADKYAPRTIDLDILLYYEMRSTVPGGICYKAVIISTEELTIPDPLIPIREFILVPLAELAPELIIPGQAYSLRQLAEMLDHDCMEPFKEDLREPLWLHGGDNQAPKPR